MSRGASKAADDWAGGVPQRVREVMAEKHVTMDELILLTRISLSAMYRRMTGRKPFDLDQQAMVGEMLRGPVSRLLP